MAKAEEHGDAPTITSRDTHHHDDILAEKGDIHDFSICDVLFCTPHGNMSKEPAKFFNVTSALPNANALHPTDLVAAAEKACAELPKDDSALELYRSTKTGMFNFSIATHISRPLAKFRIPANTWSAIAIHFDPSSSLIPSQPHQTQQPQQHHQQTIILSQKPSQKARLSRSYSFVHNSCTYTWKFASGMEIRLQSPRDGCDRVLAKFFFKPSWFRSCGVLGLGRGEERGCGGGGRREGEEGDGVGVGIQEEKEVWERVVVLTLLAVLRREREWRYTLAGHFFPIKRTVC